jgi:hypothetical protein
LVNNPLIAFRLGQFGWSATIESATDWQGAARYPRALGRAGRFTDSNGDMNDLLEGVRSSFPRDDRALARILARRGQVAYAVFDPVRESPRPVRETPRPKTTGRELRLTGRRRTRLRSAKILDAANAFVCDCLIYDRSATGLRLTLARDLGLPPQFQVHDDETGAVELAATVWRRGATLGVRFCGYGASTLRPSERAALRGRYYAVRD